MSIPLAARFDSYRLVAFGSITGSYTALGTAFTHTNSILKIINTCDTAMAISFDGSTNNDYLPAGGFTLYDLHSNLLVLSPNTQLYVKYISAPSSGSVVAVAVYPKGS